VAIDYRWADNDNAALPALAADLVRRQVALIVASGGAPFAAIAAKQATSTIPIVFIIGANPVKRGLVASLNRPGGNLTGVTFLSTELGSKRLELLRDLVPHASTIAYLAGPSRAVDDETSEIVAAARLLEQEIVVVEARNDNELETAFAAFVQRRAAGLIVAASPFLVDNRRKIVALAARNKIPAVYPALGYVFTGGLMSYSADETEGIGQAAVYVGRILKGEKPADLPVQQATRFKLAVNIKTAKSLGLEVPPKLLAIADQVIE
jgi:putative tryptophan/tyrosine transport system substrate-binding protein